MPATDRAQLLDRWKSLCARLGLRNEQSTFDLLFSRYTNSDRHYHDIRHIASSLRELDGVRHLCENCDAVELAVWFHDCVYNAHRLDNEELSARIATAELAKMGAPAKLIDEVCNLILATRHTVPLHTPDERLIVDIDLAPLGADEHVFDANSALIRREYQHLDAESYAEGRAQILRQFLKRPRIYATDAFAVRFERQARLNLERSLAGSPEAA